LVGWDQAHLAETTRPPPSRLVAYSNIKVGMNGGGYTYGISPGPSWTAAKYYVHSGPVGGLFGTLLFSSDHTLISTGGLAAGVHAFTTYWHKF
jgi:hypothetical protein